MEGKFVDVSVVIPTYNRPQLVKETVQSVLAQSVPAREIIVVDNGTNDETRALFATELSEIVYIRMPPEGMQAARNAGIARARGEWIATLDDDDLWRPNLLEQAQPAIADGRADLIFCDHHKFDSLAPGRVPYPRTNFGSAPPGYWDGIPQSSDGANWSFVGAFPVERVLRYNPFYPSTMIARRSFVDRIGGYNSAVRNIKSEDIEFLVRALLAGQLSVIWESLVDYRVHGGNSCGNNLDAQALGRWRIFEFIRRNGAYGNETLQTALERDLPDRRARAYDRAWRASRFADTDELRPLLRKSDWTLARKLRQMIRVAPEPLRETMMRLRGVLPRRSGGDLPSSRSSETAS